MPTQTLSTKSFADLFAANSISGLVSLNLAAELLGVKRSTLLTMEHASLVKVEGETDTTGVDADWLREEMRTRRLRDAQVAVLTVSAVRDHIEQRLACSGFGNGRGDFVEYGAHLMAPFGLQHHIGNHRTRMGDVLGEVSTETFYSDHVILSAVVVNKSGRNKGRPSNGFWALVESLGFELNDEQEKEAFWRNQIQLIREHISRNVACPCEKCRVPEFLKRSREERVDAGPVFSGSLAFIDDDYAPLEVSRLQRCREGVQIISSYVGTDGVLKFDGVAFKTGVDPHTGKDIYQTGMLPLHDANDAPVPDTYASLRFTIDQGLRQRYLTGVWTDGDDNATYEFAGDLDMIE